MKRLFSITAISCISFLSSCHKKDSGPDTTPLAPSFSVQKDVSASPIKVICNNTTTGSNVSYEWDFGDNMPKSTEKNPVHYYYEPGTYTITLKASTSSKTSTISQQVTIDKDADLVAWYKLDGAAS